MNDDSINKCVSPVNGTDDREAHSKFWIAAYTRPRGEKKACKELQHLGLEVYLPTQRQMRQWSDRKKLVDTIVIPMIVFLHVTEEDVSSISRHPLILRMLSFPGGKCPAKIPLEQIKKLKYILGQSDVPVGYDSNIIKVNDNVRVSRGKLMGLCGEVISCSNSMCELIIQIDLLGGARLAIPKTDIEVINK